jgi:DNA polymerase III subunit gamma/tau
LLKEKDPPDSDALIEDSGSSEVEQTDPVIQDTDFSEEELLTHWKKFAIMVREEKPRLYSTLVAEDPMPDENKLISFEVSNKLQMEAISEIKPELVHFLRKQLNNNSIKLDIKINEQESESRPYHPEDKFSRLAEKNPELHSLKQDLGLDFE